MASAHATATVCARSENSHRNKNNDVWKVKTNKKKQGESKDKRDDRDEV